LLKGLHFLTQTLLPLLADGGAIVNTTNNSALLSRLEPGYSAYASMKGGLIVLTRWRRSSAQVSRILGHARATITLDVYTHLFEEARHAEEIRAQMAQSAFAQLLAADNPRAAGTQLVALPGSAA